MTRYVLVLCYKDYCSTTAFCEALCDWQRFEIGSTNGMLAWYSDIVKQELPWVNARQKVWILQYWQTLIKIVWLDEVVTFVHIAWVCMACSGSWDSPMRIEAPRFHNTFCIILFPPGSSMRKWIIRRYHDISGACVHHAAFGIMNQLNTWTCRLQR